MAFRPRSARSGPSLMLAGYRVRDARRSESQPELTSEYEYENDKVYHGTIILISILILILIPTTSTRIVATVKL